jgi:hypothetical protein
MPANDQIAAWGAVMMAFKVARLEFELDSEALPSSISDAIRKGAADLANGKPEVTAGEARKEGDQLLLIFRRLAIDQKALIQKLTFL